MDKLWQFWKEKKNQKKTKTTNGLVGGSQKPQTPRVFI